MDANPPFVVVVFDVEIALCPRAPGRFEVRVRAGFSAKRLHFRLSRLSKAAALRKRDQNWIAREERGKEHRREAGGRFTSWRRAIGDRGQPVGGDGQQEA